MCSRTCSNAPFILLLNLVFFPLECVFFVGLSMDLVPIAALDQDKSVFPVAFRIIVHVSPSHFITNCSLMECVIMMPVLR